MSEKPLYRQLERPWLYRLSQTLLSPGSKKALTRKISELLTLLPEAESMLDVGCGPESWLWRMGKHPIGLDLSFTYMITYGHLGEPAITASAIALPFPEATFDAVWSIGLLHHLPGQLATQAINEMLHTCRQGGYVVIIDAVLPEPSWHRPLAYFLRRADRGRYVRPAREVEQLLPFRSHWSIERYTYSLTGLETLICWLQKDEKNDTKSFDARPGVADRGAHTAGSR